MPESELKSKPRMSIIVPLPVSLLLVIFFFLPWLTISCNAGEFTKAMQISNVQEMPPGTPTPPMPEVTAEVGHASGWQLAKGDISLEAAYARQDSPVGSENNSLKSRPLLYLGLVLPILALLLSGFGATGNAVAKTVGTGLLLLGIAGVATIFMAASIDYVDDTMDKLQEETPRSCCLGPAPCRMGVQNAKSEMKKLLKTKGTFYLWASLGMYVLLAGCGIAARGAQLKSDFQLETSQERVSRPRADMFPNFGPALTPKEPSSDTEDAAATGNRIPQVLHQHDKA